MNAALRIATTAPVPSFRDFAGLFGTRGDQGDSALARPWTDSGDAPFWFSRAAWGLGAVVAAHRKDDPAPRLWLPDFFCNQSAWAARQAGAAIIFYPVRDDLEPDWPACETLAKSAPPALFLQVHFFGRPANLGPARQFCDMHAAHLIEDAAHALGRSDGIGQAGDYVLWSPYKHLPVPDGGLLVVRPSAAGRRENIAAAAGAMDRSAPGSGGWLARRLLQRAAPGLAARLRRGAPAFDQDPSPGPLAPTPALSVAARRMILAVSGELTAIAARRIATESALREAFAGARGLAPLLAASGGWTPYRMVFRAADPASAAQWYGRFLDAGLAVETWPDIAPEVRGEPLNHRAALALRNSILALPVNADAPPGEIAAAYAGVL